MKRYEEIEAIIASGKLSKEEILVLNEATLMKNVVEFQKNKVKNQHETIVIPLFDEQQQVIRRMGVFDRDRVKSTEVDVAIMKGEVHSPRFLILPIESDGARLFEHEPKPQPQAPPKPDKAEQTTVPFVKKAEGIPKEKK